MTTNERPNTFDLQFYDIALADDSDPDPTWDLRNVPAHIDQPNSHRAFRILELLLNAGPLTFHVDTSLFRHGVLEYIVLDAHDKNLGTLFVAAESGL